MAILLTSSFVKVVLVIALYSMCHEIKLTEGRFLWDLSTYCINYCSRVSVQMPPIGVCSCHRITSYHRRMALTDDLATHKRNFQDPDDEDPTDNYT